MLRFANPGGIFCTLEGLCHVGTIEWGGIRVSEIVADRHKVEIYAVSLGRAAIAASARFDARSCQALERWLGGEACVGGR